MAATCCFNSKKIDSKKNYLQKCKLYFTFVEKMLCYTYFLTNLKELG